MTDLDISSAVDAATPTPEQLRALTHPIRLQLLGLLRLDGPQTATELSQQTGLNTGSTSYHLRILAKYGFIAKDTQLSKGRKLVWRACNTATVTDTPEPQAADAQTQLDAMYGFQQVVAAEYARQSSAAAQQWRTFSPAWQDASTMSDFPVRVTPAQAREIMHSVEQILLDAMRRYPVQRTASEEDSEQSDDRQAFTIQLLGFPLDPIMHAGTTQKHQQDQHQD
jgi:hypothetical protein